VAKMKAHIPIECLGRSGARHPHRSEQEAERAWRLCAVGRLHYGEHQSYREARAEPLLLLLALAPLAFIQFFVADPNDKTWQQHHLMPDVPPVGPNGIRIVEGSISMASPKPRKASP